MTRTHAVSAVLIALLGTVAAAQTTTRVTVSPESKLWIEGTSNLHDWSCKATTLNAAIEVDPGVSFAATAQKMLKRVDVKVPVRSLKCGHGGMDNNLYKALNADDDSEIDYIMATFEAVDESADGYTLRTTGSLSIAGKVNQITMDVVAERLPDGSLKATGTVPVKMTEFGIKPPTALFGRIKTGDEVKVKFELSLGAKSMAAVAK
jgi:polyisoprenoid-binding protein YceI